MWTINIHCASKGLFFCFFLFLFIFFLHCLIIIIQAETFQKDLYPPTQAAEPALTAEEWISGERKFEK